MIIKYTSLLDPSVQRTTSRFKRIKIILLAVIFSTIFWFSYSLLTESKRKFSQELKNLNEINFFLKVSTERDYYQEFDSLSSKNLSDDTKFILFWEPMQDELNFMFGSSYEMGEEMLKSVQCPVTNCFTTHNRKLLGDIKKFDVLLMHSPFDLKRSTMPKQRSDRQLYVLVSLESPLRTSTKLNEFKNFYNLTMTYRLDSDVRWDYGKIIDKETNEIVAPSKSPKWKEVEEDFYDEEMMEIIKNKTSPIAWFVSNCINTRSYRDCLVNEIKELMPVDVYGECGTFKCAKDSKECDDLLDAKYRFYLSFENSLSKDYISEKVFYRLGRFVIPVVYNGADTSLFAPPKSYIDANKFKDVKELTDYLQYLTDNPQEYIKYFWWKKHYIVVQMPTYAYTFCDLCKKLNDPIFMSEQHQIDDIESWYFNDQQSEPKIKFDIYTKTWFPFHWFSKEKC